jgi:hypothetical protein
MVERVAGVYRAKGSGRMPMKGRVNWMNFFEEKITRLDTDRTGGGVLRFVDFEEFLKQVEHFELEQIEMNNAFKDKIREKHSKELRDRHHYFAVYIRKIRNDADKWKFMGENG